jgi:hypothetical protein
MHRMVSWMKPSGAPERYGKKLDAVRHPQHDRCREYEQSSWTYVRPSGYRCSFESKSVVCTPRLKYQAHEDLQKPVIVDPFPYSLSKRTEADSCHGTVLVKASPPIQVVPQICIGNPYRPGRKVTHRDCKDGEAEHHTESFCHSFSILFK